MPEKFSGVHYGLPMALPMMNKDYFISDLIDSTNFIENNDSIFFTYSTDLKSYHIDTQMNINAKSTDEITIISNTDTTATMSLSETGIWDDDIKITYGIVDSWTLQIDPQAFHVNDSVPLQKLSLIFDDVYTPNGENNLRLDITDFDNINQFNLDGYIIGNPTNTAYIDTLTFHISTQTSLPENVVAPVGQFRMFFNGHIYFDELNGTLFNKVLDGEDQETNIDIDYPENIANAIDLSDAKLKIGLWNTMGFDVTLFGKLTGYNDTTGDSLSIIFNDDDHITFDAATTKYDSVYTEVTIEDSVPALINIMPNRIKMTNVKFYVGRYSYDIGYAYKGAGAHGNSTAIVPFNFIFHNSPIKPDTLIEIDISGDNQDLIDKQISSAALKLNLDNHIPVGGKVSIYFSPKKDSVFSNPTLSFIEKSINPEINNHAGESEINFDLPKSDLNKFLFSKIYCGLIFNFQESNSGIVIHPQNFINVKGRIEVLFDINTED
jgi:hypothetical protein